MSRTTFILVFFIACLALAGQQVEDLGLNLEQLEDKLLVLVNQERSGRGVPELRPDSRLRDLARAHCRKMIAAGELSHDFPGYDAVALRAATAGLYFSKIGENVASGDTFVMRLFHEQLLSSPGHRANMLDRAFTHLGIGIEKSGDLYYICQEFAALMQPLDPMVMETTLAAELKTRMPGGVVLPPAAAAEIAAYCRGLSEQFLQGKTPRTVANSYGLASIHGVNFINAENGLQYLIANAKDNNPLYWSLGVTFNRTSGNPGGTYAVSMISFPDLRNSLPHATTEAAVILESLNRMRKNSGLVSMAMIPKLTKPAADIARLFYRSSEQPAAFGHGDHYKLILTYQASALDEIPADVARQILDLHKVRTLGIHVFYPLAEGLPGNYFIVAILGL